MNGSLPLHFELVLLTPDNCQGLLPHIPTHQQSKPYCPW